MVNNYGEFFPDKKLLITSSFYHKKFSMKSVFTKLRGIARGQRAKATLRSVDC